MIEEPSCRQHRPVGQIQIQVSKLEDTIVGVVLDFNMDHSCLHFAIPVQHLNDHDSRIVPVLLGCLQKSLRGQSEQRTRG